MNKKLTTSLVASLLIATSNLHSEELSQITVVSATKSEQSIKDVTSNIDVITKAEIEERHFNTVSEAINSVAGINVISNGGLGKATSVFMRGFDTQRILVLIDGIRYNDFTGISGARFEHLMMSDIEQIEIIKGAQSGIWGADANAGVINIITSKAKKGTHGNVNIEYGSYNTKKVNAKISHKDEKFDVSLGVTRINSDGFTAMAPRGNNIDDYEDDGYQNTTINAKVGYDLNENNRLEISHNRINARSEYDKGPFGSSTAVKANGEGYELETKNQYTSANYINKNKFSDLKMYANYVKIDRDDKKGFTKEFDGTMKEYGINAKIPYNKDSFILTGIDYKITKHKNDVNKTLKNKGAFITNSTKYDKLIFTQSLRYDTYDLFNNKTTGKIGFKYNYNKDLYFTSNIGTSYNVPTFYKLYNSSAGFVDLEPESTKSFDITFGYKGLEITYFHNKIDNMIEYNDSTFKYYNMDKRVRLEGIEIALKKEILEDLLFNLSYTYTDAKDGNDKPLERRAKDSIKLGLDYYGIKNFHFNVNAEYVGDRKQYTFGTYDVSAETGNYTIWNGVINYDVNNNLGIYMKLDNIFDKNYQTIADYATARRSAYVGLIYKF
ncbi:TonB-dependent receptor plug domain-containing protein [Arcobacter sp.]|uniref:TonB-dependent receptor plug domain-containing protein n=1 Tax=Arcobacter sp. TaxID=1872629 RepID=UPI003C75D985